MERRERRPDPAVSKRTVTIGGHSTQVTMVDLSMGDPNASAPQGEHLQSLLEEVRKTPKIPVSRKRRFQRR